MPSVHPEWRSRVPVTAGSLLRAVYLQPNCQDRIMYEPIIDESLDFFENGLVTKQSCLFQQAEGLQFCW